MPSPLKKVAQNLVILWNGYRVGRSSNTITLPFKRKVVEAAGFEDPAAMPMKGPMETSLQFNSFDTGAMTQLIAALAASSAPFPWCALLDSDITQFAAGTPVAVGSNALFFKAEPFDLNQKVARGAMYESNLTLQGQDVIWLGPVLFSNLGQAALGTAGSPFHSTPQNVGPLLAAVTGPPFVIGSRLGVALFVCQPPGVAGTAPVLAGILESAAAFAFTSPTTRATFANVSLVGGAGSAIVNPSQFLSLDGDVAAVSDTWWRVTFTVTGTGAPGFTVVAVMAIQQKIA